MGLEQFLTEEDKVASLTEIRSFMYKELFQLCIRAGIDPMDFEYETWEIPEYTEENRHLAQMYGTINQTCKNLIIIDRKLAGNQ
jgi:hypothetical protein